MKTLTWGIEIEISLNQKYWDFDSFFDAEQYWYDNLHPGKEKIAELTYKNILESRNVFYLVNDTSEIPPENLFDINEDKNTLIELMHNNYFYEIRDQERNLFSDWMNKNKPCIKPNVKKEENYFDKFHKDFYEKTNIKLINKQKDFNDYKSWSSNADITIEPYGIELVSPILNKSELLTDMKIIFDYIKQSEFCETNYSTGLHINVGTIKDFNSFDLLKFLLFLYPNYISKLFNREKNNTAKDIFDNIKRVFKNYNNFNDVLDNSIFENNKLLLTIDDKYLNVNLKKLKKFGYLEIRAPGGVGYEEKYDLIKNIIEKISFAIDVANDKDLYKTEYYKKLYKLFSDIDMIETDNTQKFYNAQILSIFSKSYSKEINEFLTKLYKENESNITILNKPENFKYVKNIILKIAEINNLRKYELKKILNEYIAIYKQPRYDELNNLLLRILQSL